MGMSGGLIGGMLTTLFGDAVTSWSNGRGVSRGRDRARLGTTGGGAGASAAEMAREQPCGWGRFIEELNRLPRPSMAFGTLGLIGAARGWRWCLSRCGGRWGDRQFLFRARMQVTGQGFGREMIEVLARI